MLHQVLQVEQENGKLRATQWIQQIHMKRERAYKIYDIY